MDLWDFFFVCLETVQETMMHLVEPQLVKFNSLLEERQDQLHFSWWIIILKRGVLNSLFNVRRRVLDFIFSSNEAFMMELLKSDLTFTSSNMQ